MIVTNKVKLLKQSHLICHRRVGSTRIKLNEQPEAENENQNKNSKLN